LNRFKENPMSISALNTGLSGMQAFQRALDVTSNNIANVDTNGFKSQQAQFQSQTGGGVNVNPSAPGTGSASSPQSLSPAQLSATDLASETVNSLQYKYGFDLSAQVVKSAYENLGTLVNIQA
jgi:flagellar hook protein FlgE